MKFLPVFILLFSSSWLQAQTGNPATYKVGVAFPSNLMPVNDRYEFQLSTGEKLIIDTGHKSAYFERAFKTGDHYSISQISGTRTCTFANNEQQGTVSNHDIMMNLNCGAVKTSLGKMKLLSDVTGESFSFKDNYGRSRTIPTPWANDINLGGFPTGDPFMFQQTGGPRTCVITPALTVFPETSFFIQVDCRKNNNTGIQVGPAGSVAPVKLTGTLTAPAGTKLVLELTVNGKTSSLPVTASGNTGTTITEFSFAGTYLPGTPYKVNIKTVPATITCAITENADATISSAGAKVRVVCDKTYDLVTRSSDDKLTNTYYESWAPVIAGKGADEGRYVAFAMYGKGVDGSSGNHRQIFWRDRKTGITKLVSKNAAGNEGDANSFVPSISADGQSVAFESYAKNLCDGDNNGSRDVFVWNTKTGKVTLVSKGMAGGTANSESSEPVISGDGSVIAYTSNASNIAELGPLYSTPNVYVYDVNTGAAFFITKDHEKGTAAGGYAPAISEDGNKVAFCAFTYKLTPNDNNNLWDIFLWEKGKQGLKRISKTAAGGERNQGTESSSRVVYPALSGNGEYIAFATTSSDIVNDDKNELQDIYLYQTTTGQIKRVSSLNKTTEGNGDSPVGQGERVGINYDGSWITYNTSATNFGVPKGNIVLHNTITGQVVPVTQITHGSTARPMLSRSGSYIVAGCSEMYDKRFSSSGIFAIFTGKGNCSNCEPLNTPQ